MRDPSKIPITTHRRRPKIEVGFDSSVFTNAASYNDIISNLLYLPSVSQGKKTENNKLMTTKFSGIRDFQQNPPHWLAGEKFRRKIYIICGPKKEMRERIRGMWKERNQWNIKVQREKEGEDRKFFPLQEAN